MPNQYQNPKLKLWHLKFDLAFEIRHLTLIAIFSSFLCEECVFCILNKTFLIQVSFEKVF